MYKNGWAHIDFNVARTAHFTAGIKNMRKKSAICKSQCVDEFIRKNAASGRKIFEESTRRIGQIINFPEYDFNQNVACLVEQHKTNWLNEQIHFQSQKIISMPVIQVKYHSRRDQAETGQFWIFGDTREVLWSDIEHNLCPNKCSTCDIL